MQWDSLDCFTQDLSGSTNDGSGYSVVVDSSGENPVITDRGGNSYSSGGATFTDPNNNKLSFSFVCNPSTCPLSGYTSTYTYTDTTLQVPVTETQTWTPFSGNTVLTKDVHSWTDAAGKTQAYTFNYSPYTHLTNFGCYLPSDQTAATWYMPSSITTPEGTYSIYYESISGGTTGRISQITFPSGASVQYGYSGGNNNSGLTCEAQTPTSVYYNIMVPVLTRTLIDTKGTNTTVL